MGPAGAAVADEAERVPVADPRGGAELVDRGRIDRAVGVEVEVPDPRVAGKPGGLDPAGGPAAGPVVALG